MHSAGEIQATTAEACKKLVSMGLCRNDEGSIACENGRTDESAQFL